MNFNHTQIKKLRYEYIYQILFKFYLMYIFYLSNIKNHIYFNWNRH